MDVKEMLATATGRPWRVERDADEDGDWGYHLVLCGERLICKVEWWDEDITRDEAAANAALIVRAVNNFEPLLEENEKLFKHLGAALGTFNAEHKKKWARVHAAGLAAIAAAEKE